MKGAGALGFCLAAMLALGGCFLWPKTPSAPTPAPLPGDNINDWGAHAVDGGGQ